MADDRDKSARYVLGGKRHDDSKGKKYTKWRENFLDAAEGEGDADYSMAQTFLGQDGPRVPGLTLTGQISLSVKC